MAMNKSEKEMVEALKTDLALRHTKKVASDLDPPSSGPKLLKGWLFNAHDRGEVVPACTSCVSHSYGQSNEARSQGSRRLFSTRLRALQALRWEMEQSAATKLRRIDRMIEEETQLTSG